MFDSRLDKFDTKTADIEAYISVKEAEKAKQKQASELDKQKQTLQMLLEEQANPTIPAKASGGF